MILDDAPIPGTLADLKVDMEGAQWLVDNGFVYVPHVGIVASPR